LKAAINNQGLVNVKQLTKMSRLRILLLTNLLFIVPVAGAAGTMRFRQADAIQQNTNLIEDHIRKGKEAYEAKNYAVARNEAREALQLNKESPEANLLLALASRGLNRADDAMKYARKAIQYRQDYADAHYLLAVLLYEKNNPQKAASELETAIHLGARFVSAFILKGTLEILKAQRPAAIESYKEALRLAGPDAAGMTAIKQRVAALEAMHEFAAKHHDDPSYKRPIALNAPMPRYTEEARNNKVQGVIQLAVLINEEGKVVTVVLLTSLGHGLDEEAVRAAGQLRFSPAMKDGKAVAFWQSLQIEFWLR
jgi:TonB family protein